MKSILLFFYNRFALNAFISENYPKAIKYYLKIQKLLPEKKGIDYNLGLCYLGNMDYESAQQALLSALAEQGEGTEIYKTFGDLYYIWGNRELALENYCKLLELSAGQPLGRWLKMRISLLESAGSMQDIKQANAALAAGIKYMKNKDFTKAEESFVVALTSDPSNYQAFNNYGVLLQRKGEELQKALIYFEEAVSLNPINVYNSNLIRIRSSLSEQKSN